MENWVVSIQHWGNGYCEWKAVNGVHTVYGTTLEKLMEAVKEKCND